MATAATEIRVPVQGHNILDRRDRSLAPVPGTAGPVDIVEKFGWATPGARGEFRMISKHELHIDERYQREAVSATKVIEIAKNWDWRLFGALSIGERPDRSLWVYEGGHRARASFYRKDITYLPCLVFKLEDIADEARAFVGTNTLSSAVKAFDKHKASVLAREPIAVLTEGILHRHGYRAAPGVTTFGFTAIARLTRCVRVDTDLAERVFAACVIIDDEPGHHIPERVLGGLYALARKFGADVVLSPDNIARLREYGSQGLLQHIHRESLRRNLNGEAVWAEALLLVLDKGRRVKIARLAERRESRAT
jgi:hypothetical protein